MDPTLPLNGITKGIIFNNMVRFGLGSTQLFIALQLCYCVVLLVALSGAGIVHGYPSGAPVERCIDMTPGGPHAASQQLPSSPYQIMSNAFSDGYIPGQTYNGQ